MKQTKERRLKIEIFNLRVRAYAHAGKEWG